jgi:hypothetical protein
VREVLNVAIGVAQTQPENDQFIRGVVALAAALAMDGEERDEWVVAYVIETGLAK